MSKKKRIYEEPTREDAESAPKKKRRKRKPMTEEQRAAAAERLKIARAKRSKNTVDKSVHASIRDLPEDHYLHPKKVKAWMKSWKEYLTANKNALQSNKADIRRAYQIADAYVKNMQTYLSTGAWSDSHYGENREHKINFVVEAMAYNPDGTIKRTKGLFYKDIGTYTGELNET